MNVVICDGKKIESVDEWNKLNRTQLLCFARCVYEGLEEYETKIRIAYSFSGIPLWKFIKLTEIQKWELGGIYSFVFTQNKLSKQLLPSFRIGIRKYYGPNDDMKNMAADEFATADRYYRLYRGEENQEIKNDHLNNLIACIYRYRRIVPRSRDDVRRKFNHNTVDIRSGRIKDLNPEIKYAILLHYIGVRNKMIDTFPNVFTAGEKSKKSFGWPEVFYNLSGGQLGTVDQVQELRIWNLFYILEFLEVRRKEREEEMENERSSKS